MSYGDNWTKEETQSNIRSKANQVLNKLKQDRQGKRFKLIPHPTLKNTQIEIEIKDDEINP